MCGTTVLVVCPDFSGIPSCFVVLLHLSQIPLRDLHFKIPTMLSQRTVRKGRSASGEVAGGEIPAGRCWHSVPMRWHSLGWQVEKVLCWWSWALHATCQSQHHLSCTGHSAQPVHPALQMTEQCFIESSSSEHSSEMYHDTSQVRWVTWLLLLRQP